MNLGNVWTYLVENFLQWVVIIGIAIFSIKFWKDQKIGAMLGVIMLGAIIWLFLSYPKEMINIVAEIPKRVFGLGG